MVLAIIGAVFSISQISIAGVGASNVKYYYGSYFDDSDCEACREVCRFNFQASQFTKTCVHQQTTELKMRLSL